MRMKKKKQCTVPGRGACGAQVAMEVKTIGSAHKIFSRKKDVGAPVTGAPDIAYPDDVEKWERQTELITAFVFEMWERVEAGDEKAAREARAELQTFLVNGLGQLLRVALEDKDSIGKQWACKLLADIFVGIGKHVGKVRIKKPYGKLMETTAFVDEKKLMGKVRRNVLFPVLVRAVAQGELKQALAYRKRLMLLRSVKGWKQAAKAQKIPQEYWPTVKFPEFSTDRLEEWFTFLWPLIQKKIDLSKLPPLEQHDHDAGGNKARTRYLADSRKTAYDHLKALAKLRDKGAF